MKTKGGFCYGLSPWSFICGRLGHHCGNAEVAVLTFKRWAYGRSLGYWECALKRVNIGSVRPQLTQSLRVLVMQATEILYHKAVK